MLKDRNKLEVVVKSCIRKSVTDRTKINNKIKFLTNEYGVDERTASDVALMKRQVESCDDRLLYVIAKTYNVGTVDSYYTPNEIKSYNKKYEKETFKFPIKINAIKVNEDQYLGTITVKELMKFRDAQLINYNENAQRAMKKVVEGNDVFYQISLNKKAVEGIKESFNNNTYISNTITLNIPVDGEFTYNGEELIISSLEHFDILDGYHRYIAMSEISNIDTDFDYTMELRIVSFTDEKARQFIWQEDQKTKMKKIDSEAFNQNTYSNQLIGMLNESALLRGIFNIHGIIDSSMANRMLSITFFYSKRKYSRKELIDVKKYILHCFEVLLEESADILDKEWDNSFIISFFYAIWKQQDESEMIKLMKKVYAFSQTEEYQYLFKNKSYKYSDIRRLEKFMEV